MQGKVVGYEIVDYQKKNSEDRTVGLSVHVLCNPPKNVQFEGQKTKEIWVNDVLLANTVGSFVIGNSYVFDYEQNGKYASLVDILPVDTEV